MLSVTLILVLMTNCLAYSQVLYYYSDSTNYTKIESTINVVSGNVTGYYYSTSWFFNGKYGAYMGWQPREGIELQHLTFSAFGEGAHSDSPNCSDGADGAGGVSCWLEYPWKFGQNYTFITELVSDVGEYQWNGTIIDDVTGIKTHVASYYTPKSFGLISYTTTFDEWYLDVKKCIPKSSYIQYFPILYKNEVAYDVDFSYGVKQTLGDPCSHEPNDPNYRYSLYAPGAFYIENGIYTK